MSVEVIDKIKPKNNADFPLVDAADIEMPDGTRLSDHDFLESSKLPEAVNVALTQAKESGAFDGKTPVKGSDYWTAEDKQEIVDDVLGQIDIPDVSVELPVFDLAALGMSAVTLPAGYASVNTDTTELQSALSNGDVIFVIPVNMGGTTIPVHAIMQGIALGTSYQCMTLFVLDSASALVINVEPGFVSVMVMPAATAVGFPEVTTDDNGKFLQVVDGSWAAVALQDVSEVGA